MSYIKQLHEVLDSPCYSNTLKDALRKFDRLDCVDALKNANALAAICMIRVTEVQHQSSNIVAMFNK